MPKIEPNSTNKNIQFFFIPRIHLSFLRFPIHCTIFSPMTNDRKLNEKSSSSKLLVLKPKIRISLDIIASRSVFLSSRLFAGIGLSARYIEIYRLCRRDASLGRRGGVFGSRHRFTGEEFYRRHFVALRFHAVNVAASRRVFARVCTDSKKRLFHVAHDGDPCRRGNAEYRREVQPLFSKLLLAGFAILRAPFFLSPRASATPNLLFNR